MMGDTKLWRLAQRGYDPQDFLRERLRLQKMHVGRKKSPTPQAHRIAGEALSTEERAAMASALERREEAPIKLPRLDFLERRLPGEPKSLTERWK